MHFINDFTPESGVPVTKLLTFTGEARSGKGTSVRAVQEAVDAEGRSNIVIDQGYKFRAMTALVLEQPNTWELFNDQVLLGDFLNDGETRQKVLDTLGRVAVMSKDEKDALLYNDDVKSSVKIVGTNPRSHDIAVGLLFDEVRQASQHQIDTVLLDGRSLEKYGQQLARERVAQYVLGFFFQCDSWPAALREAGAMADPKKMSAEKRLQVLEEIAGTYSRNRTDTQRDVDPMRPPHGAYALSLEGFSSDCPEFIHNSTLDALRHGTVTLNTSYTRSVEEMTVPVVALSMHALHLQDRERERFLAKPNNWASTNLYGDPGQAFIASLPPRAVVLG